MVTTIHNIAAANCISELGDINLTRRDKPEIDWGVSWVHSIFKNSTLMTMCSEVLRGSWIIL